MNEGLRLFCRPILIFGEFFFQNFSIETQKQYDEQQMIKLDNNAIVSNSKGTIPESLSSAHQDSETAQWKIGLGNENRSIEY